MSKLNIILLKIEIVIGSSLLLLIFVNIITNIVLRYFVGKPFFWSDELSNYSFVWMGFLACAYGIGTDSHIRLTIVEDLLNNKTKQIIRIIFDIIIMLAFFAFSYYSFKSLSFLRLSSALRWPLKYIYAILPVSFAIFGIHSINNIFVRLGELKANKDI